jgi:mono/diheme cytochrome c family protein
MPQRIAILMGSMVLGLGLATAVLPTSRVNAGSKPAAHGAELFATRGCAHCHGDAGVGGRIGPDLQLVRKRMTAEAITKQIHDGGQSMPAFRDQLSDAEIKDLVKYLRAKRKLVVVPPRPAETPAGAPH